MVIGEGGPPRGVFFFESLGPGWDSGQLMYFSWSRFTLFKMVCVHIYILYALYNIYNM